MKGESLRADLLALSVAGVVPYGTFGALAQRHGISRQRVQQVATRLSLVGARRPKQARLPKPARRCVACGAVAALARSGKYCEECRTVTQPCAACGVVVQQPRSVWLSHQRDPRYRGRVFCNHSCAGRVLGKVGGSAPHRTRGGRRPQTHCQRGHPLIDGNLYSWTSRSGRRIRQCKACAGARKRARYAVAKETTP